MIAYSVDWPQSTLLRIIATLMSRDAGNVQIGPWDIDLHGTEVHRLIGYVGHDSMLYPALTVVENLHFYAALFGIEKQPARERIEWLLEQTGIASLRTSPVGLLSQGQLKRASIARSLLHDPPLLLLDEPFAGLDSDGRQWLVEMPETETGRTVLLATHQLDFSEVAAQRVFVLDDARIDDRSRDHHKLATGKAGEHRLPARCCPCTRLCCSSLRSRRSVWWRLATFSLHRH